MTDHLPFGVLLSAAARGGDDAGGDGDEDEADGGEDGEGDQERRLGGGGHEGRRISER